jgi:hypothetical protein
MNHAEDYELYSSDTEFDRNVFEDAHRYIREICHLSDEECRSRLRPYYLSNRHASPWVRKLRTVSYDKEQFNLLIGYVIHNGMAARENLDPGDAFLCAHLVLLSRPVLFRGETVPVDHR